MFDMHMFPSEQMGKIEWGLNMKDLDSFEPKRDWGLPLAAWLSGGFYPFAASCQHTALFDGAHKFLSIGW
jgi:hypothetical protein